MEIPPQFCAAFHESSNRPKLLVGCERNPIAAVFALTVTLCFSFPHWWGIAGSLALFFGLRQILQAFAQKDPIYLTVWLESRRYHRDFWTAQTRSARRWRTD